MQSLDICLGGTSFELGHGQGHGTGTGGTRETSKSKIL